MKGSGEDRDRTILRILDANANRCAEGLRVIEEIARFELGNEELFKEIKEIRHSVRRVLEETAAGSFKSRDIASDVGSSFSSGSEDLRSGFPDIRRANFLRAEEALRVMEEFGKLLRPGSGRSFKELRFRLYNLERRMLSMTGEGRRMPVAPFLYAFVDRSWIPAEDVREAAGELISGGADIIQYRAKECTDSEKRRDLLEIVPVARSGSVPIIVNDLPEIAAETGADGVHLGMNDPDPLEARSILGRGSIIGLTVHEGEEIGQEALEAVDYIAFGAIYPTRTKPDIGTVGTELLARICRESALPVVAIGGISSENIEEVLDAGASGAAVIGAILDGDIRKNCFTLKGIIDRKRGNRK